MITVTLRFECPYYKDVYNAIYDIDPVERASFLPQAFPLNPFSFHRDQVPSLKYYFFGSSTRL